MATSDDGWLEVGRMVLVASRTWPGINKPGGVGSISHVHNKEEEEEDVVVDVSYVLGGREKRVPLRYVQWAPQYEQQPQRQGNKQGGNNHQYRGGLRDRSMLLGRCKRCGSLRTDCGSCDWMHQQYNDDDDKDKGVPKRNSSHREKRPPTTTRTDDFTKTQRPETSNFSDTSSSSEDSFLNLPISVLRRRRRRRQTMARDGRNHLQHNNHDDDDDDDDESSSDDEAWLASLLQTPRRTRQLALIQRIQQRDRRQRQQQAKARRQRNAPSELPQGRQSLSKQTAKTSDSENDNGAPRHTLPNYNGQPEVVVVVDDDDDDDSDDGHFFVSDDSSSTAAEPNHQHNSEDAPLFLLPQQQKDNDELYGFIQPEGTRAAVGLPNDTVDQTRGVPFRDLPDFFAHKMEELQDRLADANLQIARLDHWQEQGPGDHQQEAEELYERLLEGLVREGLDQCSTVLRKLRSRSRTKRLKETLDPNEFRKGFSWAAREARELALDQINPVVQDTMNRVRRLLLRRQRRQQQQQDEEEEPDHTFTDGDSDHTQQELQPTEGQEPIDDYLPPSVRPLGAFDPHQHATRVRKKKRRRRDTATSGKSSKTRREPLAEAVSNGSADLVVDASVDTHPSSRRRKQRGTRRNERRELHGGGAQSRGDSDEETMEPPPLETILRQASSATTTSTTERVRNRGRRNVVSAVDRMQAFLAANSGTTTHSTSRTLRPSIAGRWRNSSRRNHDAHVPTFRRVGKRKRPQGPNRELESSANEFPSQILSQPESLLETDDDDEADASVDVRNSSVDDQLRALRERYPKGCTGILSALADSYGRGDENVGEGEALEAFSVVLELMQKHGNLTLVEMMHVSPAGVKVHIQLLGFLLNLIRCGGRFLHPRQGLVHTLFGGREQSRFIHEILLQFLDALYACFFPEAWASPFSNSLVRLLEPLRDALATMVPIMDTVCEALTMKVRCQVWRQTTGEKPFVSSVDPERYRSLLAGDATSVESTEIRFGLFKNKLPRKEITAIHSILEFVSHAPCTHLVSSKHTWRLVAILNFSEGGVLASKAVEVNKESIHTPPSEAHKQQCMKEVLSLLEMISTGTMDPIPTSDNILVKIMRRVLLLFAKTLSSSEDDELIVWAAATKKRSQGRTSLDHNGWERALDAGALSIFAKGVTGTVAESFAALKMCMKLASVWSSRVHSKRARMSRFLDSITALRSALLSDADKFIVKSSHTKTNSKDFSAVFRSQTQSVSFSIARAFLHEAAASIALLVCSVQQPQILNIPGVVGWPESVKKVWDALSQKEVAESSKGADGASKVQDPPDIGRCLAAARLATCVGWFGVDWWLEKPQPPDASLRDRGAHLQLSLRGLGDSIDVLKHCVESEQVTSVQGAFLAAVLTHVSRWTTTVCALLNRTMEHHVHDDIPSMAEVWRRILYSLNSLLSCFLRLDTMGQSEQFIPSTLGAIRSLALLLTLPAKVPPLQTTAQSCNIDSEFGDIDDDVFLNIDLGTDNVSSSGVCSGLIDLLDLAKPSRRFAIVQSGVLSTDLASTSVPYRSSLAGQTRTICSILALLSYSVSIDEQRDLFSKFLDRIERNQPADQLFHRNVVRCFYMELCSVSATLRLSCPLIEDRIEQVLECFVGCIFDSASMERFTSCDFRSIESYGGRKAEMKERQLLELANTVNDQMLPHSRSTWVDGVRIGKEDGIDIPGPVYNAVHFLAFCHHLGQALELTVSSAPLSEAVRKISRALGTVTPPHEQDLLCLERECLSRLDLARALVGFSSSSQDPICARVAKWLLQAIAREIIFVVDGLQYREHSRRAARNDELVSHSHAKLLLLEKCFVEMFAVVSIAVIDAYRLNHAMVGSEWLRQNLENLIIQVLQNRDADCRVLINRLAGQEASPAPKHSAIWPKLRDNLRWSLLRRSVELVRCFSRGENKGGVVAVAGALDAIASSGGDVDSAAKLVASGFERKDRGARARPSKPLAMASLPTRIDNQMSEPYDCDDTERIVTQTRRFMLEKVICKAVSLASKAHMPLLLHHVLEVEREASTSPMGQELIKTVVRSISHYLRRCIACGDDVDRALHQAFLCTLSVARLPYDSTKLVVWVIARTRTIEIDATAFGSLPSREVFSLYMRCFFLFCKEIAVATIARGANLRLLQESISLSDRLRGEVQQNRGLENASRSLVAIEELCFDVQDSAPTSYIRNSYVRHLERSRKETTVAPAWVPTAKVVRAAKDIMAQCIGISREVLLPPS